MVSKARQAAIELLLRLYGVEKLFCWMWRTNGCEIRTNPDDDDITEYEYCPTNAEILDKATGCEVAALEWLRKGAPEILEPYS